ncbi:hypothetical protein [Parendozoicomonas sp. Alg238-R29]|uniref:hypothetical protein n=1 Tax=Parendozoicomonas sp. Alg238-R29 TaxID=2993446 RepID=UPI00248D3F11|nr:hypothetical protein [Parendozoicomonas sp. Alg238-R29]
MSPTQRAKLVTNAALNAVSGQAISKVQSIIDLVKDDASTTWNGIRSVCTTHVAPFLSTASAATANAIVAGQNATTALLGDYIPAAMGFVQQKITSVPGVANVGSAIGLGAVASTLVSPHLASGLWICTRTLRSIFQKRTNNSVMKKFAATNNLDEKKSILEARAKQLEDRSIAQKSLADRSIGLWGAAKYLMTFATPALAMPQIGALISVFCPVSAPAVLPICLSIGAGACALKFLTTRFDSWRERKAAEETMKQAAIFRGILAHVEDGIELVDAEKDLQAAANKEKQHELLTETHRAVIEELHHEKAAHKTIVDIMTCKNESLTKKIAQADENTNALTLANIELASREEALAKEVKKLEEMLEEMLRAKPETRHPRLQRSHSQVFSIEEIGGVAPEGIIPTDSLYLSLDEDTVSGVNNSVTRQVSQDSGKGDEDNDTEYLTKQRAWWNPGRMFYGPTYQVPVTVSS